MPAAKQVIPGDRYYDCNDYWVKMDGSLALIGMTEQGQSNTGDILYLELVDPGTVLQKGQKLGSIESGKWVGSLVAPVSGLVVDVNRQAEENPYQVNEDAYGQGWMFQVQLTHPEELTGLMDAEGYRFFLEQQAQFEPTEGIS